MKQKNKNVEFEEDGFERPDVSKGYVTREFIIMIKETLDNLNHKKRTLEMLKGRLGKLVEVSKVKRNEMSSKIAYKIYDNDGHMNAQRNVDLNINEIQSASSHYTEASSRPVETDNRQDDIMNTNFPFINDMNSECDRIMLISNRRREEAKDRLLKSKELVTSACGLISRICKEIRVTNKNGQVATIDVIETNVSKYMSLCGLKFEKLMRNNKLIKAQFERLVEINVSKGGREVNLFNIQNEANIYGFGRVNIKVNPETESENESDKKLD